MANLNFIRILTGISVFLLLQCPVFANPVPVFVLFNFIPDWTTIANKKCIYEYKLNSHPPFYDKKYIIKDGNIYEYKLNATFYDKKYIIKDGNIYEYKLNATFYDKKYIFD